MLPILYQSPELIIYSYPLFMGLGWGVGYHIFMHGLPRSFSRFFSHFIFWGLFFSSWIGSKVLFIMTQPANLSLAEDLNFWTGGGFVFYGGFLLGAVFLLPIKWLKPLELKQALEKLLPALLVGHGIGRIGCFLAGCCYGKPSSVFWAVHQHGEYRHPTQLYEALGLGILAYLFIKCEALRKKFLMFYLLGYGSLRLVIEQFRGDEIRGNWWGISPSATVSFLLLSIGMLLHYRNKSKG